MAAAPKLLITDFDNHVLDPKGPPPCFSELLDAPMRFSKELDKYKRFVKSEPAEASTTEFAVDSSIPVTHAIGVFRAKIQPAWHLFEWARWHAHGCVKDTAKSPLYIWANQFDRVQKEADYKKKPVTWPIARQALWYKSGGITEMCPYVCFGWVSQAASIVLEERSSFHVLDLSAGWGARAIAYAAWEDRNEDVESSYTGVDPDVNLVKPFEALKDVLSWPSEEYPMFFYNEALEDFVPPRKYDLLMLSLPRFGVEKYAVDTPNEAAQPHMRYRSDVDPAHLSVSKFVKAMCSSMVRLLEATDAVELQLFVDSRDDDYALDIVETLTDELEAVGMIKIVSGTYMTPVIRFRRTAA